MPTRLAKMFTTAELSAATLARSVPFTRGVPPLKVPATPKSPINKSRGPAAMVDTETALFDLGTDPGQTRKSRDPAVEARLPKLLTKRTNDNDAPDEAFRRFGLRRPD